MKEQSIIIKNLFIFSNNLNYLKELSQKDNYKIFKEKINHSKKYLFKKILTISLISIFLLSFFSLKQKYISNYYLYLFTFCSLLYYFLVNKVIDNFNACFENFIKLCREIIRYESIIKNKLKIILYQPETEEKTKNNINSIINCIQSIIFNDIEKLNDYKCNDNNTETDKDNNNNKKAHMTFRKYLKLKEKLFEYIFIQYDKEYVIEKNFFLKYFEDEYSNNNINKQLKKLINEYSFNIQKIKCSEENYFSIIKKKEQFIKDEFISTDEIKKNEIVNSIYDLLLENYKLNENFIDLIKNINQEKKIKENDSNGNKTIEENIEYIIEKNQMSIRSLEQIKKKIRNREENEEEIIFKNNNNQKSILDSINEKNEENGKKGKKGISLLEIELGLLTEEKDEEKNENNNNKISISENKSNNRVIDNMEIFKEKNKLSDLKNSFINELNEYCQRVKGKKEKENLSSFKEKENDLNKNKFENNNKIVYYTKNIFEKKEENEKKNENNTEKIINQDKCQGSSGLKLDFAKSITMALKQKQNNFLVDCIDDIGEHNQ